MHFGEANRAKAGEGLPRITPRSVGLDRFAPTLDTDSGPVHGAYGAPLRTNIRVLTIIQLWNIAWLPLSLIV